MAGGKQQMPLHGNTSSKVYHAADCEHYMCKTCTAQFATARQAEAAGFHACRVCEGKEGVATANKQPRTLRGNPDSKMLHGPSCKYFNAKDSTEKFTNMDQAVKKGYLYLPDRSISLGIQRKIFVKQLKASPAIQFYKIPIHAFSAAAKRCVHVGIFEPEAGIVCNGAAIIDPGNVGPEAGGKAHGAWLARCI